jgi:hypothetical protein
MKQGSGKLQTSEGIYEGSFDNGELGGKGKFTWKDGKIYIGTFENGALHGEGVL